MATITKEMTMGEVLSLNPANAEILLQAGMHCVGCPAHAYESLQDAAAVHGVDIDALIDNLNNAN